MAATAVAAATPAVRAGATARTVVAAVTWARRGRDPGGRERGGRDGPDRAERHLDHPGGGKGDARRQGGGGERGGLERKAGREGRMGGGGRVGSPAPPPAAQGVAPEPARRDRKAAGAAIAVGETENKPELLETLPIVTAPGSGRRVVLTLAGDTKTDSPLPDLAGGDRLLAMAELELTTDADDPNHPGLIGNAYTYSPNVEAVLLLAPSPDVVDTSQGAIELSRAPWRQTVSHQHHHAVITFGDAEARIPEGGLPWQGPAHVNLVVEASSPDARDGDVMLVGQNETTPTVVQDMAGIRVVRFRPADAPEPAAERDASCLCAAVPVAKRETVVLSHELAGLRQGDQLLVRGTLVTDAAGLASPARISTRMFIADAPDQTDPGGDAAASVTWKGHLSKFTGFNCVPGEGPQTSRKYGVATIRRDPGASLYVNMVAVSGAPFGGLGPSDQLRVDTTRSSLEVVRFAA